LCKFPGIGTSFKKLCDAIDECRVASDLPNKRSKGPSQHLIRPTTTTHHLYLTTTIPKPFLPFQIKLSKPTGIERPTEDLQPSTVMTSIFHVVPSTDFLPLLQSELRNGQRAKRAREKTIESWKQNNNGAAGLAIDPKTIHPMDRKSDRLLAPAADAT
jgi:hypothetical protein